MFPRSSKLRQGMNRDLVKTCYHPTLNRTSMFFRTPIDGRPLITAPINDPVYTDCASQKKRTFSTDPLASGSRGSCQPARRRGPPGPPLIASLPFQPMSISLRRGSLVVTDYTLQKSHSGVSGERILPFTISPPSVWYYRRIMKEASAFRTAQ